MTGNDLSPLLADTEVHYLSSEHVGDELKIVIGHCGSSEGAARVVFTGDAWANFGTAVETIRLLQFTEDLPPLLVAAVGYRTVDMDEIESLRNSLLHSYRSPDLGHGGWRESVLGVPAR